MTTVDRYDPPTEDVLSVVAAEWVAQLVETAADRRPGHPLLDVGDAVPPYVDEFDVGWRCVDDWHGGNPDPALAVVRREFLDAGAITRLRSSAIGAIERRDVRWAVHHGIALPKSLADTHVWEVTDVMRFEAIVGRLRRPHPGALPDAVRHRVSAWAARPETATGAPERGRILDDFIASERSPTPSDHPRASTQRELVRRYTGTGQDSDPAEHLWRWLNAEGALRKPTLRERVRLGPSAGVRVWDRARLGAALPELTVDR